MTRESVAQETAATAPYGEIDEHLLCGTCKREIVWDMAKGWVHKHDGKAPRPYKKSCKPGQRASS